MACAFAQTATLGPIATSIRVLGMIAVAMARVAGHRASAPAKQASAVTIAAKAAAGVKRTSTAAFLASPRLVASVQTGNVFVGPDTRAQTVLALVRNARALVAAARAAAYTTAECSAPGSAASAYSRILTSTGSPKGVAAAGLASRASSAMYERQISMLVRYCVFSFLLRCLTAACACVQAGVACPAPVGSGVASLSPSSVVTAACVLMAAAVALVVVE